MLRKRNVTFVLLGGTVAPQSSSGARTVLELNVVLSAVDFVLNEIDLQRAVRVGAEGGKIIWCNTNIVICVCIVPGCLPQFRGNFFFLS